MAANSAGAIRRADARFDLVRVGIETYGLAPAPGVSTPGLTPAMTVRSEVSFAKRLPAGERVSSGLDIPGLPMREELARIARAGLAFEPGTEWRYSVAIDVLGAVVAVVEKKSLPDAVRELVTGPLALADTGFTVREARRLAVPYYQAKGGLLRMGEPQDVDFPGIGVLTFSPSRNLDATSFPSGGAGMSATAIAFARLLDAIRAGGSPLLKRDTARVMLANQIGTLPTVMGPGWGFGYGGAVLTDATAAQTPQSNGTWLWSGVYGNSWFVDPVRGLTVVAFTNTAPEGDSGPFVAELRDAVYGTEATDSARPTSCAVATDANCQLIAMRVAPSVSSRRSFCSTKAPGRVDEQIAHGDEFEDPPHLRV
jgi:CubicO group peptidase (beta-lactamase class C family)